MIKKATIVKRLDIKINTDEHMWVELEIIKYLNDCFFSTTDFGRAQGIIIAGLKKLGYSDEEVNMFLKTIIEDAFFGGIYFAYKHKDRVRIKTKPVTECVNFPDPKKESNEVVG